MISETATDLKNDDLSKATKRRRQSQENLDISSLDNVGLISEADMQDTIPGTTSSSQVTIGTGSETAVQIKRTRMEDGTANMDLAVTDEISHMASPTRIGPSVDGDTSLDPASQSSLELFEVPVTKTGSESGTLNEPDAARTSLSSHELSMQSEQQHPKRDQAPDGSIPPSEVTLNGNVQIEDAKEKKSSNENTVEDVIVSNQDNPAELSNSLPKQVASKRKKLLVLDINGLLADIVSPIPRDYRSDANIARRAIFKRPFCNEFLMFCFDTFEVGIWSSRTQKNVERVIDFLLGDLKDQLLFCWDVTQCTPTGFSSLENKYKTLMFKEIRKLWEPQDHGLPWEDGHFNESNTLLVDDSPYKALLNPSHTSIFPQSYSYQNRSDTSLGVGGDIRSYLEELAAADHVQQHVEKHPFGQEAISQSSPSWDFYHKAIISLFILQDPTA
uniref:Mitochondrial import inner membrane translocase subunit TIM50 n=1 Tax=Kalanchoe fedtschenkoi TaxID=63787 RepID=A0A7N1A405_KALFE